ncbi:hypothetical protein KFE25_001795 [Diacronema lutheri]|uniref:Uncharacterized protein n=1 Tax=Diacronema lutheri TaxID=2081491 RepID=A0A8J5XKB7_DIALT|nr:hypothetical protein KFE25_001795 [Diacronema lutheri]
MTGASMCSVAYGQGFTVAPIPTFREFDRQGRSRRKEGASRVAGELAGTVIARPRIGGARANPTLVPSRSFSVNDITGMSGSPRQGAMESFLLYVARSFSMDIGELWSLDLASSLRLTNMYVAPQFYERHSARILYPDADPRANPSRQHRFSRELCMRAVMRGEPLWCDISAGAAAGPAPAAPGVASGAGAPATDEEGAQVELPLRTAVAIPFNLTAAGQAEGSASETAVLVLYSSRYKPLPSRQVMHTVSAFTRAVATQRSMASFLSTLSARLETFDAPGSEAFSIVDRLGLSASALAPAYVHELDKPERPVRQCSLGASVDGTTPMPIVAPPAPSLRGQAGSTFAQRRMRQMLARHASLPDMTSMS